MARSYLSTAAKNDVSFIDAFVMLAEGQPWVPAAAWVKPQRFQLPDQLRVSEPGVGQVGFLAQCRNTRQIKELNCP